MLSMCVKDGVVEQELLRRQSSAGGSSSSSSGSGGGSSSDLLDGSGAGGQAKWTEPEDDLLTGLVEAHGTKRWNVIAKHLPGRTGKQVR